MENLWTNGITFTVLSFCKHATLCVIPSRLQVLSPVWTFTVHIRAAVTTISTTIQFTRASWIVYPRQAVQACSILPLSNCADL